MLGGEQDAPAVNDEGAGDNDPGDDNGANNNLLQMIPLEAVWSPMRSKLHYCMMPVMLLALMCCVFTTVSLRIR